MRQSWETMTSVSAGHIIQTPTQPVGSGRPQRESNPGPPHQESRALPQSYRAPQYTKFTSVNKWFRKGLCYFISLNLPRRVKNEMKRASHSLPTRTEAHSTHKGRSQLNPQGQKPTLPTRTEVHSTHKDRSPLYPQRQKPTLPTRVDAHSTHKDRSPLNPQGQKPTQPTRTEAHSTHKDRSPLNPQGQKPTLPTRTEAHSTHKDRSPLYPQG